MNALPDQFGFECDISQLISRHCISDYPRECCGILLGRKDFFSGKRLYRVNEIWPTKNLAEPHEQTRRYVLDPVQWLRAHRHAEASGQDIIGFYHSHPDHPAVPSETDASLAWPDYCYVIVPVSASAVGECRGWVFDDEHARFIELKRMPCERA